MFNEVLFREKYNLFTNNIPESMKLAHMSDRLLLESMKGYEKTEAHITHKEIFDHYIQCGGTVIGYDAETSS